MGLFLKELIIGGFVMFNLEGGGGGLYSEGLTCMFGILQYSTKLNFTSSFV